MNKENSKQIFSLERFEGETAILEDDGGNRLSVRRATLPENAKEGDRFEQQEDGSLLFLEAETLQKKQDIRAMLNSLWKDS